MAITRRKKSLRDAGNRAGGYRCECADADELPSNEDGTEDYPCRAAVGNRERTVAPRPLSRRTGALLVVRLDDPEPERGRDGFGTRMHFELLQNGGDVVFDSLRRDVQSVGELAIGMSAHQQGQDLDLARSEPRRILTRRGTRSAWNPAYSHLAQPLPHDRRQRAGP